MVEDDAYLISVSVSNSGDRPTTLTGIGARQYTSLYQRLVGRPAWNAVLPMNVHQNHEIPCVLEPGTRWEGMMQQPDKMVELSRSGYLYILADHTGGKKPARRRLIIRDVSKD